MDLIGKYLDAVRPLLPLSQRDDILEELEGVLRGRLEDKAAELGRPLSRKEEEAVLADFGHPFMVAGRYGPQHTLIGPDFYPLWWLGVRGVIILDVIVHLARAVAVIMTAPEADSVASRLMALWGGLFSLGFLLIGAVTVAVAAVERFKLEPFGAWSADNSGFSRRTNRLNRGPRRVETGGAIIGSVLGTAFFAGLPWIGQWGHLVFGRHFTVTQPAWEWFGVHLGPICFPVLWAMILGSSLVQLAAYVVEFASPLDRAPAMLLRALAAAVGVATCIVALTNGPVFVVDGDASRAIAGAFRLSEMVTIGLWASAAGCAFSFLWYLWRFTALRRGPAAAQSRGAVTG